MIKKSFWIVFTLLFVVITAQAKLYIRSLDVKAVNMEKKGYLAIIIDDFGYGGEGTKEMLDDMHKRKIDMADAIYVINVGGYIGSSTKSEIEYAKQQSKEVYYLEVI